MLWTFLLGKTITAEEVEDLAKEAMRAVSKAEETAQATVRHAKEEADLLRRQAESKSRQLIDSAVKEAKKRAEILYGVARADGEKRRAALQADCQKEQEQLRSLAQTRQAPLAREVERIVLGHSRRR